MDAVYKISECFNKMTFKDLPHEAVEAAKKLILDTLAVGIAGSSAKGARELYSLFMDQGGKEESSAWIFGEKMPCANAAQLNATMVHALDFDDTHDRAVIHVGGASVPPALAVSEKLGNITGKQLITAVVQGVEIASRLCLANTVSMFERGWHYTTLHGNFNAAAVAGKLSGLSVDQMVNAFGLVYHQANGNLQGLIDGALAKRLGPGFAVRNGITAVLMASNGLTGARNVFQGKHGLFNVYHRGDYDPDRLTMDLGEKFEVTNLSYKPYPCCRENHVSIDAALDLVVEYDVAVEDIEEIVIHMSKEGMTAVFDPLEDKQEPKTVVDAQFSTPWTVALALVYGRVGMEGFTPEAIRDEKVIELSRKVRPVQDDSLSQLGVSPTIVKIITKDGRELSKKVEKPFGSPENPMSMEDMGNKLRDCIACSYGSFSDSVIERLISFCNELESLDNANSIAEILTSPQTG